MTQMKTRLRDISNELPLTQVGVKEGLQKFPATALCISAPSFCTFWPVLGEVIFDRENDLNFEKWRQIWKLYLKGFPKIYLGANFDTWSIVKTNLKVGVKWRCTFKNSLIFSQFFYNLNFTLGNHVFTSCNW